MTNIFASRKGVSLFEVVIVIAIFSGMMFVISSFIISTTNFEDLINQKLQVRQDLEQTFQIMTTEMRSMGPSSIGAYPIEKAESSTFTFYSDIDEDGIFEKISYYAASSTFYKSSIKPTGIPFVYATASAVVAVAVEKVVATSTPIFEYYGVDYTGSSTPLVFPVSPQDVRLVKVLLYADLSPKAPKPIVFSSVVNQRNLRSN